MLENETWEKLNNNVKISEKNHQKIKVVWAADVANLVEDRIHWIRSTLYTKIILPLSSLL